MEQREGSERQRHKQGGKGRKTSSESHSDCLCERPGQGSNRTHPTVSLILPTHQPSKCHSSNHPPVLLTGGSPGPSAQWGGGVWGWGPRQSGGKDEYWQGLSYRRCFRLDLGPSCLYWSVACQEVYFLDQHIRHGSRHPRQNWDQPMNAQGLFELFNHEAGLIETK